MGAVPMEQGEGESTFRMISATLSDTGFTQRVVASGKAPLLPGQKVAAAARLDPAGAVLLEESLKRPTSDISVEFDLAFTSFLPAFDGTITFDWERFKAHIDDWKMKYRDRKDCWWWIFGCQHHYTTDEIREIYDFDVRERDDPRRVDRGHRRRAAGGDPPGVLQVHGDLVLRAHRRGLRRGRR